MTFSGPTANEPKLSLKEFTGRPAVEKRAETAAPREETDSGMQDAAADDTAASPQEVSVMVTAPSDRPIEIPTQTELEAVLEPQPASSQNPVVYRSHQEVCDALTKAAQSNNLPVPFFIRLLFQESGFKPDVVSRAGAQGVAQFMPETAASVGLNNPFDPLEAIPASARLLRSLFQQFGNLGLAAAAYNAGPRRIADWLARKGKLPQETQGYVKTITGRPAENWKVAEAGMPEIRLPRRAPCQEAAGLQAWNGPARIPMPVPSPHTQVSVVLRGTMETPRRQAKAEMPGPHANTRHTETTKKDPGVAAIMKPEKTAAPARTKTAKSAIQLAARKSTTVKPKYSEKPAHTAHIAQKMAAKVKPVKFAVATHSGHK
jgi:hypothetical protein